LSRFLKASARNTQGSDDFSSGLEVSYDEDSEWQQPEASQSIYGSQPSTTASPSSPASDWSANTRSDEFELRPGDESSPGGVGTSDTPSSGTNKSPGEAYR
jgi:hypothetical protein